MLLQYGEKFLPKMLPGAMRQIGARIEDARVADAPDVLQQIGRAEPRSFQNIKRAEHGEPPAQHRWVEQPWRAADRQEIAEDGARPGVATPVRHHLTHAGGNQGALQRQQRCGIGFEEAAIADGVVEVESAELGVKPSMRLIVSRKLIEGAR